MVYQHDPSTESDNAFDPGAMEHLVPGNAGRLLDARRTPVRLTRIRRDVGMFAVEILAFEDRGARWELPFEDISRFQFRRDAARADAALVACYQAIADRLGRPLRIPIDSTVRSSTEMRLRAERERVSAWLMDRVDVAAVTQLLAQAGGGRNQELAQRLADYLESKDLLAMDRTFAQVYVSNPNSGEVVLGHEIVLAQLGLVPYDGRALRDPASLSGDWSHERRQAHIIARLAFVSALCRLAGAEHVTLYRGFAAERPRTDTTQHSFVSATFDRAVAMAHFEGNDRSTVAALYRQRVPITRLFMTFMETDALSHPYQESEAILLRVDGEGLF